MQWTSHGFWRFFEFEEFEDASKTGRQCWRLYLAQSLLLFRLPLQPCLNQTKKVGISHISLPFSLGTCCCCCLPLLSHLAVSPSQVPGAGGQVRGELALDCKRKGEKCQFEKKMGIKQKAVHTWHLAPLFFSLQVPPSQQEPSLGLILEMVLFEFVLKISKF